MRRALEMSGCRLRGSSDGSGSWEIFNSRPVKGGDAFREFENG